jgi:hypothetical protein
VKRRRVSARTALAASLALLVLTTAGAGLAGFLITTHHQHADRSRRLAEAAAYVREDPARAESRSWQANFTEGLSRLSLDAQLTLVSPASKQTIYVSRDVAETSTREDPTASYQFPASDSASAQVFSRSTFTPPRSAGPSR